MGESECRHDGRGLAELELSEQEGVRVVAVAGELDISNVGALEDVTFDLPNGRLGLIVDLSATAPPWVCCSGCDAPCSDVARRFVSSARRRAWRGGCWTSPASIPRAPTTIARGRSLRFTRRCH
jgi:hypothetical protein